MCPVTKSCPPLCDPMDCSPPGSSVHGILQARILEWVAIPSSRGSSRPRDQTHVSSVSCIGRHVLYHQGNMFFSRQGTIFQIQKSKKVSLKNWHLNCHQKDENKPEWEQCSKNKKKQMALS